MTLLPTFASRGELAPLLNKIHHCDALDLLRRLPDASVDLIVTSPPYDNLRTYKGFTWDFEAIARESFRVLKQGGVLVWVVGDATVNGSETLTSFRQALYFVDVCGFKMHDTMIWQKDGSPFPESNRYWQEFEYMFVLSKGKPRTHNLIKTKTKWQDTRKVKPAATRAKDGTMRDVVYEIGKEERTLANLWYIVSGYAKSATDDDAYEHPAIFPEELARRHIHTWSNENDIVLDYFSGSGTTAKIARNMGRQFIGCDLSAEYVELAQRRLANTDPFQATVFKTGEKQLSLFSA